VSVAVEQPKEISTLPTVIPAAPVPVTESSASSDDFEKMVQNIMDMGYERIQVKLTN